MPSKAKAAKPQDDSAPAPIRQGINRVGTWTGLTSKAQTKKVHESVGESSTAGASSTSEKPKRQPLNRLGSMGQWSFSGKNTEVAPDDGEEDDDRRIRFTIGGAGRRLTKEDFLEEIRNLDPKTRYKVIQESDAPAAMKYLAKKDASTDSAGSSRVFEAKSAQIASSKGTAQVIGAVMARQRGATIDEEDDSQSDHDYFGYEEKRQEKEKAVANSDAPTTTRGVSNVDAPSRREPETAYGEETQRAGSKRH